MLDIMRADTIILADKAYDSNAIRAKANERGAWANIPLKRNLKAFVTFSKWVYQQSNAVERFFNKLKQFRVISNRYEKNPLNFLVAIKLVAALNWIRSLCVYDLELFLFERLVSLVTFTLIPSLELPIFLESDVPDFGLQ